MPYDLNLATRRYYDRSRLLLLLWGTLVLVVLITGIGLVRYLDIHHQVAQLSAENCRLQQSQTGANSPRKNDPGHHETLKRFLTGRSNSRLRLLDNLEAATPDGVSYTLIAPDTQKHSVRLEGDVRSMQILSQLLKRLHTNSLLHNPSLVSTGKTGQTPASVHRSGTSFVITVEASTL